MKSSLKYCLWICLIGFLFTPVKSSAESMMAFGDSLTMGLWVQPDLGEGRRVGGYEPHLEYLFSMVGRSVQVYNWGVGGETTLQALQGGKDVCTIIGEDPITGEPLEECEWVDSRTVDQALDGQGGADYMLILTGTNDFFAGISPESTATNLSIIAEKGRGRGMNSIIATIPPDERGSGKDLYYTNDLITSVAQQNGFNVVDLHGGMIDDWASYVGSDNLHPTQYGYEAMARIWFGPFYNIQLTTGSAAVVQDTPTTVSAVLYGSATADGDALGVIFQYGLDASMSETVTATPESGNAYGGLTVTAEISELQFETLYYYQMISTLDGMTYYGDTKTFTTPEKMLNLSWMMLLL